MEAKSLLVKTGQVGEQEDQGVGTLSTEDNRNLQGRTCETKRQLSRRARSTDLPTCRTEGKRQPGLESVRMPDVRFATPSSSTSSTARPVAVWRCVRESGAVGQATSTSATSNFEGVSLGCRSVGDA